MAVDHGEETVVGAGGLKLFLQSWRPTAPPKAVFVIHHGLKDHSGRYAAEGMRLVDGGFAVYAHDMRGHGKSEGRRTFVRAFDEYLDDLAAVLAVVRAREPGRQIFLFGHSMGGAIVTLFAITRNFPLEGVALSAPALRVSADVSRGLIRVTKFLGAIAPKAIVFKPKNSDYSRDPVVVAAMDNDPLIFQKGVAARTAAELLRAMEKIDAKMEDLTVPFLVLHGTADRLTNPEGSRDLHRRARSRDKTLRIYAGLYHDVLHEPEGVRVFADLLNWLHTRAA